MNEPINFDIEEIFSDEYEGLRSILNDVITYYLNIYFIRKDNQILIEKWKFIVIKTKYIKFLTYYQGKKKKLI